MNRTSSNNKIAPLPPLGALAPISTGRSQPSGSNSGLAPLPPLGGGGRSSGSGSQLTPLSVPEPAAYETNTHSSPDSQPQYHNELHPRPPQEQMRAASKLALHHEEGLKEPAKLPMASPSTVAFGQGDSNPANGDAQLGKPTGSAPLPGAILTPAGTPHGGPSGKVTDLPAPPKPVRTNGPGNGKPGKPPPPPLTPPPHMLTSASKVMGEEDIRPLEEYIPFRFPELRAKMLRDHSEALGGAGSASAKQFEELCKWISLRNSLRLEMDYGDAHDKYAVLDPDNDTLALAAAPAPAVQGEEHKADNYSLHGEALQTAVGAFNGELDGVLDKAEFEEVPQEDLDKALTDKGLMGLHVKSSSEEYLDFKLYFRGTRQKKIMFRRYWLIKREIEMFVYQRLAIKFRLKKPINPDDKPNKDDNHFGTDPRPWYKRLFCGRRMAVAENLLELRDEYVYMKLFKDVLQCDIDMLLPGSIIKFTWLDYLIIWIPVLFGLGMAIWKAMKGTIKFDNMKEALMSLVLIVMPLTWGVKAYMLVKDKERRYQAHLNSLFITHNLNNNGGVISQLIDEAQEQEDNEAMLAYFFLWRGSPNPQPMRKLDLDRAVEAYLQAKIDEAGLEVRMDFEVGDSIFKLVNMGLIQEVADGAEAKAAKDKMLQALPLEAALAKAHVRNFDEKLECGHGMQPRSKAKRGGSAAVVWHEYVDIFRPTGQQFRYFFNTQTGESTYEEPDEPYVKLTKNEAEDIFADDNATPSAHKKPASPSKHEKKS